jgi:hypothetical protein
MSCAGETGKKYSISQADDKYKHTQFDDGVRTERHVSTNEICVLFCPE